jgi:integrase
MGKLTVKAIEGLIAPRDYGDGEGLYLQVKPSGRRSWVFRYKVAGRTRWMGLGSYPDIGIEAARKRARALRIQGGDPLAERAAAEREAAAKLQAEADAAAAAKAEADRLATERAMTFRRVAEAYIAAHEAGWRNGKHRQQWGNTLATYAYPEIGDVPVAEVDTQHITRILEPIWREKAETAGRVRGRIETILDYARVSGWRTGENPARWKGHLDHVLPAKGKVAKVEHHAALPWQDIAAFMALLKERDSVAALAFRFLILTAARTGEAIGATWGEIDLDGALWTVPAHRMKGGREHRVPLSAAVLDVLAEAAKLRPHDGADAPVFPGQQITAPLSNMACLMLLRRMGRADLTAHGFRSTFRDWVAEATNHQGEVAEAALAHTVTGKTEAAYQRGTMLEKRRRLMEDWAGFCCQPTPAGRVVSLRSAA